MNNENGVSAVERVGYRATHETDKVIEFSAGRRTLYLVKKGLHLHLVIPEQVASGVPSDLDVGSRDRYHNRNLRMFDLRRNNGRKPTHYGTSIKPQTTDDLVRFLEWFKK